MPKQLKSLPNYFNTEGTTELAELIRGWRNPEVRAVVLTGNGRMFCAGGDLKNFAELA